LKGLMIAVTSFMFNLSVTVDSELIGLAVRPAAVVGAQPWGLGH